MDRDLDELFASVADEPSPAFVAQLEARLTGNEHDATSASGTDVVDVSLSTIEDVDHHRRSARARRRRVAAATGITALVASSVLVLATSRPRHDQQPTATTRPAVATTVAPTTTALAPTTSATVATSTIIATTVATTSATTSAPIAPPAPAANPHWESLAGSPLQPRDAPIVVAADNELIVFGGGNEARLVQFVDGAIYSLDTSSWRSMASVPLTSPTAAVWTGKDVIALGVDGSAAAYSPATDRWRALPPSPLSPRIQPAIAWTGSEVLVFGGQVCQPGSSTCPTDALIDGAAFKPSTGAWRVLSTSADLALQGGSAISPYLTAHWTAGRWVITDGSPDGAPDGASAIYDPRTNTWRALTLPRDDTYAVVIAADRDSIEAVHPLSNRLFRMQLSNGQWIDDGQVTSMPYESVTAGWFVDGHLLVDVGSGATRSLAYRESSGAWLNVGAPPSAQIGSTPGGGPMSIIVGGRLLSTNGHDLAALEPIDDPTSGVAPCRAKDLEVITAAGVDGSAGEIYLTNRGAKPCAVNGQRPSNVRFYAPGTSSFKNDVASGNLALEEPAGTNGGYVPPGWWARVDVRGWPDSKSYCGESFAVGSVAFNLPNGDEIDATLTYSSTPVPEGCWVLSALTAVDPASMAPQCAPEKVRAVESGAGGAGGSGGIVVTFTNIGDSACSLVGQPTLEAQAPDGTWLVAAPPGRIVNPAPPTGALGPAQSTQVRTWGSFAGNLPGGVCPSGSLPDAVSGWRFRLADGTVLPVALDGLFYACGAQTSGFEQPLGIN